MNCLFFSSGRLKAAVPSSLKIQIKKWILKIIKEETKEQHCISTRLVLFHWLPGLLKIWLLLTPSGYKWNLTLKWRDACVNNRCRSRLERRAHANKTRLCVHSTGNGIRRDTGGFVIQQCLYHFYKYFKYVHLLEQNTMAPELVNLRSQSFPAADLPFFPLVIKWLLLIEVFSKSQLWTGQL